MKPSICFATMCKNEEHCIRKTLDAVAPFVDSVLVYDTGSTDGTLDVVRAFLADHPGLEGHLISGEWKGFAESKTAMMVRAKNLTRPDYILHLDADDIVLSFPNIDGNVASAPFNRVDCYFATLERGGQTWQATVMYDAKLTWKFCGVRHTIIRALEREGAQVTTATLDGCRVRAEAVGSRAFDPNKYLGDAEALAQQYGDLKLYDPDGIRSRSAFYAAQSYFDCGQTQNAKRWYEIYLDQPTWDEEVFEAHLRIARCGMQTPNMQLAEIKAEIDAALAIEPDRAEPHVYFGTWCNQNGFHEEAYRALKEARTKSYALVQRRYLLFIDQRMYGDHIVNELAVACYWTGRLMEGEVLIQTVIDQPELAYARPDLAYNLEQIRNAKVRTGPEVRGITRRTPRILIVDDFYEHPDNVRTMALDMKFVVSPDYHKGRRTAEQHRPDFVKVEIERLLNRTISKWDYGTNGVFQTCNARDSLVYHTDEQQYAAIVFLMPDAPPESGTSFFKEKTTDARSRLDAKPPKFSRGFYDATQFELVDKIGNIYNRLVIWDASLIHAASSYFGTTDHNARLFQIFFFDLES